MSGYDPAAEIAAALDEVVKPAAARTLQVAPPPPPAVSTPLLSSGLVDEAGPKGHADAPAVDAARARGVAAARSPRRASSALSASAKSAPSRNTTTTVPAPLLERLQQLRLDREVAGRPLRVVDVFNRAVQALPSDPKELTAELDRRRSELNLDRRPGDDGFIPEARFATRVSSTTEHEVALRVRALYQYLGRRIDRQDLWALALVRLVEAEASD